MIDFNDKSMDFNKRYVIVFNNIYYETNFFMLLFLILACVLCIQQTVILPTANINKMQYF